MHSQVLIIGSGPAGYTAAIYAARAMLKPTIVQGLQPGGQLTITTEVENYPGFGDVIQGPWLMEQMEQQAKNVGTNIVNDMITKVDFSSKPFTAESESGTTYTADTVIISTGAQSRWLGLPSEQKFQGYGVSACATCDGFFFKEKEVAVIGGGNSAVEEALFLTNFASKVYLVHRRDALRSEKILQERLFKNKKINIIWNSELAEITGEENPTNVTGIKLKSTIDGSMTDLKVDGVFIAIGHDPATQIFKSQINMDDEGYIITEPDSTLTNINGVYAAGDVIGHPSLASTSLQQGRVASCHALDTPSLLESPWFPYGIYSVPEISTCGMSEEDTKKRGIPYEVGVARFRETSRGNIMGLEHGMLKMLFSLKTRRVLGVQIVGEGATELIHIAQAVLNLKGTVDYFVQNTFNYPTLAEAYKIAGLDAFNRMPVPDELKSGKTAPHDIR